MVESYFEYVLSRSTDSSLASVCSIFGNRTDLQMEALKGFNGSNYILGQGDLIFAAIELLSSNGYFEEFRFNQDALRILQKCRDRLNNLKDQNKQHIDVDREYLFDVLTDVNWLLSSYYYNVQHNVVGKWPLLESPSRSRIWIKKALGDVIYKEALYDKDRSEQYRTAQLKRYQIFRGVHPDAQVKEFFAKGYTASDFKELESQARKCSIRHMALFFGLTATAAREETIRRDI